MLSERYLPMSLPCQEVVPVRGVVNSATLVDFLIGTSEVFPYRDWDFASTLDLSLYSRLFANLYKTVKMTEAFSGSLRSTWNQSFNPIEEYTYNPMRKVKVPAERSAIMFWNSKTCDILSTPIVHGDVSSVQTDTYKYITLNRHLYPLLEVHTHPEDDLPSPQDYERIFHGRLTNGNRMVNGIVVLCPSNQILALPTAKTPVFMPFNSGGRRLATYINDARGEIIEETMSSLTKLLNRDVLIHRAFANCIRETQVEMNIRRNVLQESGELNDQTQQALEEETYKDVDNLLKKRYKLRQSVYQKYGTEFNQLGNGLLFEFTRKSYLQLFMSTDMRHFSKATA